MNDYFDSFDCGRTIEELDFDWMEFYDSIESDDDEDNPYINYEKYEDFDPIEADDEMQDYLDPDCDED